MNQPEYEALEDEYLTHEARTLYVLGLRQFMDYQTGLVGTVRRRVSLQQFKELLTVSRPRRSTKPPFIPSVKQIRGYLDELERIGLIERLPKRFKQDHMVFRLPLATTDLNRLNEEGQMRGKEQGQSTGHEEGQKKSPTLQEVNQYQGQEERQEERQERGKEEGHTSVTSDIHSHTNAREPEMSVDEFDQRFGADLDPLPDTVQPTGPGSRKFAMHLDWQPDHTFIDQAATLGMKLGNLTEEQGEQLSYALEEFRCWWMESHPNFQGTQRLWQQKFIQTSLRREFNNNTGGNHHGRRQNSYPASAANHRIELSNAIFDAPGCESLSENEQADVFGQ